MQALSALCQDKLGIDLNLVPPDQLFDLLPDILLVIAERTAEVKQVCKSAAFDVRCLYKLCPNAGIVRAENLSGPDRVSDRPDPNSVFDSVLPLGGLK